MKTIGVVTIARSDYSIYLPVLKAIQASATLQLHLYATGMHLSPEFGRTVDDIAKDGFEVAESFEMLLSSDTPEGITKSMALGLAGFGQCFARFRPDLLLVLGDRFEMITAALAALPFNIPVGHIHGGEATEGSIDESLRHAMTKLSHVHFAATQAYANRIIQLGEDPARVFMTGAPALDNLETLDWADRKELETFLGMSLDPAPLLVTFHPLTLNYGRTEAHCRSLMEALAAQPLPVLFTYPNADTQGRGIIQAMDAFLQEHPESRAVKSLGARRYYSLLRHVPAMVGNSSSGIIESASFELPVVNIGDRQQGRIHGDNVLDVNPDAPAILAGINQALSPAFRNSLKGMSNPYRQGGASAKIVSILEGLPLSPSFVIKPFHDLPQMSRGSAHP